MVGWASAKGVEQAHPSRSTRHICGLACQIWAPLDHIFIPHQPHKPLDLPSTSPTQYKVKKKERKKKERRKEGRKEEGRRKKRKREEEKKGGREEEKEKGKKREKKGEKKRERKAHSSQLMVTDYNRNPYL